MKTVQPDKVFLITDESDVSLGWMDNLSDANAIRELYDNVPLWMIPYIMKMRNDERLNPYVALRSQPLRAKAKRDPRDEFDEDFARVLLARKLDAKYQKRIGNEYGAIAMRFFEIYKRLIELNNKHYYKSIALNHQIDKMNEDKEDYSF